MNDDERKRCPFCAEEIQAAALKCKHCGEWLSQEPSDAELQVPEAVASNEDPEERHEPAQFAELQLMQCPHCGSQVSVTAFACPSCLRALEISEESKKSIAMGMGVATVATVATGAFVLFLGPAAITAGAVSLLLGGSSRRKLKKYAKKIGAFDCFNLADQEVLVSEKFFTLTGSSYVDAYFDMLRTNLHDATIVEEKSGPGMLFGEKTVVRISYTHRRKKPNIDHYKFTGKDSRMLAELACAKFNEYRM